MPNSNESTIKLLLEQQKISAISLDTNVFDRLGLNFNSRLMAAVANLHKMPFDFVLTEIVIFEVTSHLKKDFLTNRANAERAINDALIRVEGTNNRKEQILQTIFGNKSDEQSAQEIIESFILNSKCKILNDKEIVSTRSIFHLYCNELPPFRNKKKSEFPDALALQALEQVAAQENTAFIIISHDSDWHDFCEESQNLYIMTDLTKALALINDTPAAARASLMLWLQSEFGRDEISEKFREYAEDIIVDATGNASSGQVEISTWSPEISSIRWPGNSEIDLIRTDNMPDGAFRITANCPLEVEFFLTFDLEFSIWDSIDKESLSMGGRSISTTHTEHVNATLVFDIQTIDHNSHDIILKEMEFDLSYINVDLGDIDVFDDDDDDFGNN